MSTTKPPRKKYLRIVLFAVIVCGITSLLGFVVYRQQHAVCKRVEIQLEDAGDLKMFSQEEVASWVREVSGDLTGKRLDSVPLEMIRRRLLSETAMNSAEVFTTIDGRCVIKVKQRIPVMRVLETSGHTYYIDQEGYPVAIRNHIFRLPLYTGNVKGAEYHKSVMASEGSVLSELFKLNQTIMNNEFWKNQIEHAVINAGDEIQLIPRVGNHKILLAGGGDYKVQLSKVKSFYNHVVDHGDVNLYAVVDARFDGQIVGIKN
jgi:cell division protein FtsQ